MIKDIPGLVNHVSAQISDLTDFAVLGMSGGADSTLVAILATLALGPERVHTLHMPMNDTDRATFNSRSWETASYLGVIKALLPITQTVEGIEETLTTVLGKPLSPLNQGNARSRARMCLLYGYGAALQEKEQKRVRVLGTGNLSEDYIGYDTKGGDALGDFFPIGELFKSEVYQLLDHFSRENIIQPSMIDRVPSGGLWDGQTDEKELGYSYDEMEPAIRKLRQADVSQLDPIGAFVWNRHLTHKHKHEAPLVLSTRLFCD
jgi:NAD+ synthase